MSTNTNTNTPAAFGYVTGHTAGGGYGGARHIIARTGTHFNGYAAAAICGTAPAGRWGTGSSAIRWTVDMNLTGEYGDTIYSTPAEAAAARPVCRRCAAAAAKIAAATVTPEAAPVEAAAAPVDTLDPATWTEGGGYTWTAPCSNTEDGEWHYTRVSDGACISCERYTRHGVTGYTAPAAEGVAVIRAEDVTPGTRVTGYCGGDPVTAIAAVAPGAPGFTRVTWTTAGGASFSEDVRNGAPVYTVPAAAPAEDVDPADTRAAEVAVMSAPGAVRVEVEPAAGLQAHHRGAVATVTAYWTGAPNRGTCIDAATVTVTGGDSHPARVEAATVALERLAVALPDHAVTAGEYQTIARGSRDTVFIFGTWTD